MSEAKLLGDSMVHGCIIVGQPFVFTYMSRCLIDSLVGSIAKRSFFFTCLFAHAHHFGSWFGSSELDRFCTLSNQGFCTFHRTRAAVVKVNPYTIFPNANSGYLPIAQSTWTPFVDFARFQFHFHWFDRRWFSSKWLHVCAGLIAYAIGTSWFGTGGGRGSNTHLKQCNQHANMTNYEHKNLGVSNILALIPTPRTSALELHLPRIYWWLLCCWPTWLSLLLLPNCSLHDGRKSRQIFQLCTAILISVLVLSIACKERSEVAVLVYDNSQGAAGPTWLEISTIFTQMMQQRHTCMYPF